MRYIVKYHNFPITWEVEAIDEADAVKKRTCRNEARYGTVELRGWRGC